MIAKMVLLNNVFISVIGLLCSVSSTGSDISKQTPYFVKPGENVSCLSSDQPCHTLEYYVSNDNFTNDSTFYFLDGVHLLGEVVSLKGIDNLSLVGISMQLNKTQIICSNSSSGFNFANFTNFYLADLDIVNCGVDNALNAFYHAAVFIISSFQLAVSNVTITRSRGYGLAAFNVIGNISINNSVFSYNRATKQYYGGNALFVYSGSSQVKTNLHIDSSSFLHGYTSHAEFLSTGTGGLSIDFDSTDIHVLITNSFFSNNEGYFGGNIYLLFTMFTNNSVRIENTISSKGNGNRGTGIFLMLDDTLPYTDTFSCGSLATHGPQHLLEISNSIFKESYNIYGGGALTIEDRLNLDVECAIQYVLIRDSQFLKNYIYYPWLIGTAVRFSNIPTDGIYKVAYKTIQATFQNVLFSGNNGESYRVEATALYFESVLNVTFIDCVFENNMQSAIQAVMSNLYFQGNNTFKGNKAQYGGGISLLQNSYIYLKEYTHIWFISNHADLVGGALFTDFDLQIPADPPCFFQIETSGTSDDPASTVQIDFFNNTADYAGSSLYGGRIGADNVEGLYVYSCHPFEGHVSGNDAFNQIFNVKNTESDPSAVTSDPFAACFCFNGSRMPNCGTSVRELKVSVYPGQEFQISAATVGGYANGTVPGVIHAFFSSSSNASFAPLQESQASNRTICGTFNYTVFSTESLEKMYIVAEQVSFFPYTWRPLPNITVHLLTCPPGFALSQSLAKCDCDPVISKNNVHCYIGNQTILRPPESWIGYHSSLSNDSSSVTKNGVLYHEYCPNNYCNPKSSFISMNATDEQCSFNRSGILCGSCKSGLSLTLGRQKCMQCNNTYLGLLLPFSVVGILLVVLLISLNLTVTDGNINGLIFYANIIRMNQAIFLPSESSHLGIFIAWLNLDFGIDTCFYNGMDGYVKTWLQFVFAIYVWLIVGGIIFMYNLFPNLASKVGGQNAVKVLATLLLLSYTKLQRTIITILSFTTIDYPDGSKRYVWLYDGNVDYLKGNHIPLFVVGVSFLFLIILPYTLVLAFFQYLQVLSGHKIFNWVNKLKPVFDAYAGPYKDRYRFWTGFLLIARTALIFSFTLNVDGSEDFNLIVVLIAALLLLFLLAGSQGLYKKWFYNIIESFCYTNLGILSGGILYTRYNWGNKSAVAYTCVGLFLLVFVMVLFYHVLKRLICVKDLLRRCCLGSKSEEEEEPLFIHHRQDDDNDGLEGNARGYGSAGYQVPLSNAYTQ